jgi:integrase/recombinase XerD
MTLRKVFEGFISEKKILNKSIRTIQTYEYEWETFSQYLDLDRDLTGEEIVQALAAARIAYITHQNALKEAGKKHRNENSINLTLTMLNSFLSWLHENEIIPVPVKLKKIKTPKKVLRVLEEDDLEKLRNVKLQNLTPALRRAYVAAAIALDTGARISEILSLKRQDIDLHDDLITINKGKGNKQRRVPISFPLRQILYKFLKHHVPEEFEYVFATKTGKVVHYSSIDADLKRLGIQLGIKCRLSYHKLRHSFATGYINRGGDVSKLQRVLGHTNISTTARYLHHSVEDLQRDHAMYSSFAKPR